MVSSILSVAACAVLFAVGTVAQSAELVWRGEPVRAAAIPGNEATAATVAAWSTFAAPRGYRLVLGDDCRTLLVLGPRYARARAGKEDREVEQLRKVLREATAAALRCVDAPADAAPAVIVCVRSADYRGLLDFLGGLEPRTKEWCERAAGTVAGFVLSEPLVAAWIEDPVGVDEWQPRNELAHRTAQLLLRRHAPRLPDWLLLGFGWHVEDTVLRSIWCFPHRQSFVSVAEHTDWGLSLANRFKKSRRTKADAPPSLTVEEFATWKAAAATDWSDGGPAMLAFGVVRYLAHECPGAVLPFAKECSAAIEKGSIVTLSAHEWTTNPEFVLPPAQQQLLLEKHAPGLLPAVTTWFQARKAAERRLAKS